MGPAKGDEGACTFEKDKRMLPLTGVFELLGRRSKRSVFELIEFKLSTELTETLTTPKNP